jgi:hypothetical protein
MSQSFESIAKLISPVRFLLDCGVALQYDQLGPHTKCPAKGCNDKIYTYGAGLVCRNKSCSFRAGGILDYLAIRLGSYEGAVDEFYEKYPGKITPLLQKPWESFKPLLITYLRNQRALYDFLLKKRFQSADSIQTATVLNALSKGTWDIDIDINRASMFICGNEDLEILQNNLLASGYDVRLPVDNGKFYMVCPYYRNYHQLSHLLILYYSESGHIQISEHQVVPSKFSYFGLLSANIMLKSFYVSVDCLTAAGLNSHFYKYSETDFCMGIKIHENVDDYDFLPEEVSCVFPPVKGMNTLPVMYALRNESVEINVCDDKTTSESWECGFDDFLVNHVTSEIQKNGVLTEGVNSMIKMFSPSQNILDALFSRLEVTGLHGFIPQINRLLQDDVYMELNGVKVYTTCEGYEIQKAKRRDRELITNFTLNFKGNLNFPGASDRYVVGDANFAGRQYPVILNHNIIQKPTDLESKIYAAIHKVTEDSDSKPEGTPKILRNYGSKHLRDLFSIQTAHLSNMEGIPYLGWSPARDKYYGPNWVSKAGITTLKEGVLHPDLAVMNYFSGTSAEELEIVENLPPQICDIISIAVGYAARGFLNYPIRPIPVINDPAGRALLEGLFRGVGQTKPVGFQQNRRDVKELPGVNGFAIYGVKPASGSGLPVFALTEHGMKAEEFDEETLKLGASTFRTVLIKSIEWMMNTKGKECICHQSILYESELIQEGELIIAKACGLTKWPVTRFEYESVESFLRQVSLSDIDQWFGHDFEKQIVIANLAKFNGDQKLLVDELKGLCERVEVRGKKIHLDSLSSIRMLENFYGKVPKIPLELIKESKRKESPPASDADSSASM